MTGFFGAGGMGGNVERRILAALQPGEAQGADPVAWQIKPLAFDWQPKDRGNPSEMIIQTDDYSAYVLIPYDKGHDPRAGIGTWNGVANHKGETGFPTREAAMRYCEDTIRADAERAVKKAMRWIEATPPAAQVTVADTIAALKAMPTRTEALGGQDFKYIQLGEALDTLRALAGAGHPSRTGRRRQMKALIVGGPNRGQVVDMSNVVHTDSRYFDCKFGDKEFHFIVGADVPNPHEYVMRELCRAYEYLMKGETHRQHIKKNGKL